MDIFGVLIYWLRMFLARNSWKCQNTLHINAFRFSDIYILGDVSYKDADDKLPCIQRQPLLILICWCIITDPPRAGPIHIWDLHFVTTMPADALAPDGARPSAGTLLTTKIVIFQNLIDNLSFRIDMIFMTWWHFSKQSSDHRYLMIFFSHKNQENNFTSSEIITVLQ